MRSKTAFVLVATAISAAVFLAWQCVAPTSPGVFTRDAFGAPSDGQRAKQLMQAGDGFRARRDWAKAKKCYEEAQKTYQSANAGRFVTAARQMADICDAMPALSLTKMKDGKYQGSDRGYVADVSVEVTVKGGRISTFRIVSTSENRPGKSQENVPQQIVVRKTPSVDVTTGATITSCALMSATLKAVQQAQPEPKGGAASKSAE